MMAIETRDRAKVGTIEYEAGLMFNSPDEFWHGNCQRFTSTNAAMKWATDQIAKSEKNVDLDVEVSAYLWRFRYVPTDFDDEACGLVLDAAAQRDLNFEWIYDGAVWSDDSDGDAPEWDAL